MSDGMWRFLVLLLFFALVPIASYCFVLLPDRWSRARRWRHGKGRQEGF